MVGNECELAHSLSTQTLVFTFGPSDTIVSSLVLAVQDEITNAVTIAIEPAIADAEQRRALRKPPETLGAWEAYQHGLWHIVNFTSSGNERAREFFERAIALDPTFAPAYVNLAITWMSEAGYRNRSLPDWQGSPHLGRRRLWKSIPTMLKRSPSWLMLEYLREGVKRRGSAYRLPLQATPTRTLRTA